MIRVEVHGDNARRTLRLDGSRLRIGRDPDCEIHLPSDPTVSRVHAVIRRERGWEITDNGSRNGTVVNGRRVSEPTPLRPDDRVIVGDYLILIRGEDVDQEPTGLVDGVTEGRRVDPPSGLSTREIDVLRLVCAGLTDQEIADWLASAAG